MRLRMKHIRVLARESRFGLLASLGVAVAIASAAAVSLAGQTASSPAQAKAAATKAYTPPRTADGQPDLQGTWANNNATPLERPKELAGRQLLTDDEVRALRKRAATLFNGETDAAFGDSVFLAAIQDAKTFKSTDTQTGNYNHFWIVDREFDNRTSLIVDPPDGKVPALTVEATRKEAERAEYRRVHPYDGPEDIPLSERCLMRGVPLINAGYNSYYQIVQSRDYVVLQLEMMHDARIIPLDGRPHPDAGIRQWLGDSRGHWEGDTLVVETTNFMNMPGPTSQIRGVTTDANLKLVERFTRVAPDTINYEATVDDPTVWTKPWTFVIPWKQSKDAIYEFACHEGNEAMAGTLGGTRVLEKAAADAAKKGSR
jgi:hypothetical protein